MTIPAPAGVDQHLAVQDTLPVSSPPNPVGSDLMRIALAVDLSPKAYRLYAVMVLSMPFDRWHTTAAIGEAAGVSDHTVRPLVAELVRARLLRSQKMVSVTPAGRSIVRYGYAVVMSA